jgi:hypothetical protein
MIYLIRWLIGKLRRRTTSPAEPLVALSERDEPAVHARGERFVTPRKVTASDANRGAPALSALGLEPGRVFAGLPAVDGWRQDGARDYVLAVSDSALAAPAVTRALVQAGAEVLSIGESRHSLEDVYLELVGEDEEGRRR